MKLSFFAPAGCILDSVVSEANPTYVLELGTYCGYSTVRIASLLSPNSKLITVEFNPEYAKIARQVIAWAGLQDKVNIVFRKEVMNVLCRDKRAVTVIVSMCSFFIRFI